MTADVPPTDEFLERIRARLGDRFEIYRELLGGGMSRVFLARELALDRQVVIKFLPPEIAADANRERFRREVQMAARLTHPHIAPLFAAAEEGELLYYTMPYIQGESLRHALDNGRKFSVAETIEILFDVADALAYAHKAGIVHRDIKPANVLREGSHAVITDFGVAKAVSTALGMESRSAAGTASGVAIGTPAYMAPEQIAGDSSADHRVDIYAFGLLGYELLTGHSPFRAPSPQALLAAQLTQAPPPILEARPDVPPVLAALLARCLEKDAARRPASAESVLEVLRAVNATSGGVQVPTAAVSSRRMMLALAALIVVIGGVLWSMRSNIGSGNTIAELKPIAQAPVAAVPPVAPPVVTQGMTKAERDSMRLLQERFNQKDARLMGLLRDSIANAVRRTVSDSIAQVRAQELAEQRQRDSLARVKTSVSIGSALNVFPLPPNRMPLTPDAFAQRANNLGPARRVGISIHSSLRAPALIIAAGVLRDSVQARLRAQQRFTVVAADSVVAALARSRDLDSLRTWVGADMWITLNVSGDVGADSIRWNVTSRDFTAHPAYSTQGASSPRVPVTGASDPGAITPLVTTIMRGVMTMDRAPRKQP
ncbi:MAG: serine/threonine-protein kinase [Gemmatimonadota bacterium]